ncbi:hypothetical protein [Solitalea koreensis]|nr:hypothetical protein [Solitalea koreensis]
MLNPEEELTENELQEIGSTEFDYAEKTIGEGRGKVCNACA